MSGREIPPIPAGMPRIPVHIRFSHCDPAGIVYYARYFDIFNGVVEDWFARALGLSYAAFIGPRRIGLGYVHAEADFFIPGFMGDDIAFAVIVEKVGNSSIRLALVGEKDGRPMLVARLVIVTTSLVEHRKIAVPDDLRAALETYRERYA